MKVSVNLACVCTGTEGTCKPLRRRSLDLIFDFKFANWLESYADTLELNVWTSSTVTKAIPDSSSKRWNVTVRRNGAERIFNVKHTIFATGFGGTIPNTPKIPGAVSLLACDKRMMPIICAKEKFRGQILHSVQYKRATDHVGRKVVVVGACTSGTRYPHFT